MNKKLTVIIGTIIAVFLSWLFYKKPQPPFGAVVTVAPINPQVEATYFAEIDANGIVLRVLVIDQKNLDTGKWGDPKNWIKTTIDGSERKNYAGRGYTYDKILNAFVPPKTYNSWVLDTQTARWKAPIAKPVGDYYWDENLQTWKKWLKQ